MQRARGGKAQGRHSLRLRHHIIAAMAAAMAAASRPLSLRTRVEIGLMSDVVAQLSVSLQTLK